MVSGQPQQPVTDVVVGLRRFDVRWLPWALRVPGPGSRRPDGTDRALAGARLDALLEFYRLHRRHIREDAGRILDDHGRAAGDLVVRTLRGLAQDPPDPDGGSPLSSVVRAALEAEARRGPALTQPPVRDHRPRHHDRPGGRPS